MERLARQGRSRQIRWRLLLTVAVGMAVPALAVAHPLLQTGPSISPPSVLAGDGKTNSVSPSASGNVMVYSDCSSGTCNISMVNLTTKQATPITKAAYNQFNPVTDGTTVVWQDGRNSTNTDTTDYTNNLDLYAANLNDKKEFLVSSGPQLQGRPSIAGNIIVWADYRDAKSKNDPNAGDIYMFDLSTRQETQITHLPSAQTRPVTNGSVVVWQDYRNAKDVNDYNADIYGYDLSTKQEFAITTAAGRQAKPTVAGNLVAWVDYRNEPDQSDNTGSDIYGYDLASKHEFPVYLGAGTQDAPTIGGTTVIYETNPDVKGGGVWSINGVTVSGVQGGAIRPVDPPAQLPGSGSQTFPQTGKTMSGVFMDYWNNNGGLAQQGYPISDVIGEISDLDGKPYTVQYFERAVFEYHPQNQPPYNVLLSQLGTFRYKNKYPNGAPGQKPDQTDGQLFPQTGHWVGGRFLKYWQLHGGLAQQGYPISDEFTEVSDLNGQPYLVQYFERAVFEYHPENQPPNDILLSQLGTFQFKAKYGGQ